MPSLAAPTAAAAHSSSMFALLSAADTLLRSTFCGFVNVMGTLNENLLVAPRLIAIPLPKFLMP
jgi:hypothetical protein